MSSVISNTNIRDKGHRMFLRSVVACGDTIMSLHPRDNEYHQHIAGGFKVYSELRST